MNVHTQKLLPPFLAGAAAGRVAGGQAAGPGRVGTPACGPPFGGGPIGASLAGIGLRGPAIGAGAGAAAGAPATGAPTGTGAPMGIGPATGTGAAGAAAGAMGAAGAGAAAAAALHDPGAAPIEPGTASTQLYPPVFRSTAAACGLNPTAAAQNPAPATTLTVNRPKLIVTRPPNPAHVTTDMKFLAIDRIGGRKRVSRSVSVRLRG